MRFEDFPFYGVGLATEFKSPQTRRVRKERLDKWLPLDFLEFGGEVDRGLDDLIRGWLGEGRPALYHLLDYNVSDPPYMYEEWASGTRRMVQELGAKWCTGDIGYWYYGRPLRENMALLHPILTRETLKFTSENCVAIREALGIPYMPENTPVNYHIGDMELLDFYAELLEMADTGLTLDCTHLAQYQSLKKRSPISGLDNFPLDRIVEIHIGGATYSQRGGLLVLEDSHHPYTPSIVWDMVRYVIPRARNLKAVCLEIESADHHQIEQVAEDLMEIIEGTPFKARLDILRKGA